MSLSFLIVFVDAFLGFDFGCNGVRYIFWVFGLLVLLGRVVVGLC